MGLFWIYQQMPLVMGLMILVSMWDLVLKALALWRAAKRRELAWFIALLILNTAGILPIIYLLLKADPDKKTGIVRIEKPEEKSAKTKATKKTSKKASKAPIKKIAKKTTKKTKRSKTTKSAS